MDRNLVDAQVAKYECKNRITCDKCPHKCFCECMIEESMHKYDEKYLAKLFREFYGGDE